jgi:hypothetical protein
MAGAPFASIIMSVIYHQPARMARQVYNVTIFCSAHHNDLLGQSDQPIMETNSVLLLPFNTFLGIFMLLEELTP